MKKPVKKTRSKTPQADEMRSQVEKIVRDKAASLPEDQRVLSPEEARQTLHELRVLQIELQMQNEELHQAQAELEAERARYFDLYHLAPVGYLTVSEKGLIMEANTFAAILLGVTRGTLIKQLFSQFILPEDQDLYYRHRKKLLKTSEPQACELRLLKKDGTIFWTLLEARTTQDGQGASLSRVVLSDITEQKLKEKVLQESEVRFRELFNRMSSGVAVYEVVDNGGDFIFRDFNPAAEKIEKVSRKDIIGKRVSEAFPGVETFGVFEVFQRVWQTGKPEYYPENIYKDERDIGSWRENWVFKLPTGEIVAIYNDITERKRAEDEKTRLEAQLHQAQKMESVGRLAGGVAHDFNNMLAVILGHAELALIKIGPEQPFHADLEEIRKAAERSANLTRQLLAFARKQTITPKVLDLNETVEGMLKMLRILIGEDIDLAWLPGKGAGPVKVDPSQIDQILANLCVNARDAIAGVGRITIETNTTTFDEGYHSHHLDFEPREYVQLIVSDNGCGMDKETLANVFEPFFTTKEEGKGTGLGLATVYGIVKQNKGFINVYSKPGKGTTFTIYLPRHEGVAQVQEEGAAELALGGHETILLVEDEPAILNIARMMLLRLGYTVLAASSPREASRLAEEYASSKIHLLVTDVVMPDMNGPDLARNLVSVYPHLKSLFISGYTADVVAHYGVLDKGVHFIRKPFSIKELAAKVRETMDGK